MRLTIVLAMAAALAVPSYADSDVMDQDVACLVSISMLPDINKRAQRMSDAMVEQTAMMGTMYFIGKITGRDPKYDIEDAIVKKLHAMDNAMLGSTLVRCGGELQDQGTRWQTIGKHMIDQATGASPKP